MKVLFLDDGGFLAFKERHLNSVDLAVVGEQDEDSGPNRSRAKQPSSRVRPSCREDVACRLHTALGRASYDWKGPEKLDPITAG